MSSHPGYVLILEARKQDLTQARHELALAGTQKKQNRVRARIQKLEAEIASIERMVAEQKGAA